MELYWKKSEMEINPNMKYQSLQGEPIEGEPMFA